jgi:hypothetical protein
MAVRIYIDDNKIMFEDSENTTALSLTELQEMSAHASDHYPGGTDELLLDEDDMSTDSEDKGASQQSIKAYVDEQSTITTTIASSATPTPARASKKTEYEITALSEAAEFGEPTGTPANGDLLFISVTDNGTTRALTYDAIYDDPYSAELPTDTTANLTILMLFRYSTARTKWELLFTDEEA